MRVFKFQRNENFPKYREAYGCIKNSKCFIPKPGAYSFWMMLLFWLGFKIWALLFSYLIWKFKKYSHKINFKWSWIIPLNLSLTILCLTMYKLHYWVIAVFFSSWKMNKFNVKEQIMLRNMDICQNNPYCILWRANTKNRHSRKCHLENDIFFSFDLIDWHHGLSQRKNDKVWATFSRNSMIIYKDEGLHNTLVFKYFTWVNPTETKRK